MAKRLQCLMQGTGQVKLELKSNGGGRMRFNQLIANGSTTLTGVDTACPHSFTMHLQPPNEWQPQTLVAPPPVPAAALGSVDQKQVYRLAISDLRLSELAEIFTTERRGCPLIIQIELDDHALPAIVSESVSCPDDRTDVQWGLRTGFLFFEIPRGSLLTQHSLQVSLCLKNAFSSNRRLASMNMTLHTLAAGPEQHEMALLAPDSTFVGKLNSTIQLAAECAIRLTISDVAVQDLAAVHGDGSSEVYLVYSVAGWPRAPHVSVSQWAVRQVEWKGTLPALQGHSYLPELLQESLMIELWAHATETCSVEQLLGHTVVPLQSCVESAGCTRFCHALERHGEVAGQISATLSISGLPRCAQMSSGLHRISATSECITNARPLLGTLELPHVEVQLKGP